MGVLFPLVFLLSSLVVSLAQEDLSGKAFVFPLASNTAYVSLKANQLLKPLLGFTLCERFQTDLVRPFALFSYATKSDDNELLLHHDKLNVYSLFMKHGIVSFDVSKKPSSPTGKEHVCVSWESKTGLATFWWNGKPMPRKLLMKGQMVHGNASIILGQEQDSFGGHFDVNQSFVGEIEDLYLWDRVLSSEEICRVWDNRVVLHPIIDWRKLTYKIQGEVALAPSTIWACRGGHIWQPLQL